MALLALLLQATGCAVPGEPLPPLLEIPAPITTLTAQQEGSTLMVRFPVPQLTTEGTRPKQLEQIDLLIAYGFPGAPAPDLASQGTVALTLRSADIPDGTMETAQRLALGREHIGQRAWLAVRAKNRRGVDAGLSNIVVVDVVALPGTPTNLSAIVTEHAVNLQWNVSQVGQFGEVVSKPAGYEIFRNRLGIPEPPESIGKSSSTSYSDDAITLGQSYRYSVRAIVPSDVSIATTALSSPLDVVAVDRFPPAAPANLRAIAVTGAVELAWSPNLESDLAGYNVYRTQVGEGNSRALREKLNNVPLDISLYRDQSALPAHRYGYTVTALDGNGNESPPSNEEFVETE